LEPVEQLELLEQTLFFQLLLQLVVVTVTELPVVLVVEVVRFLVVLQVVLLLHLDKVSQEVREP
jgi:hypothetical protein